MKRMKKIVSMLLAVVMVLGMSMTVFADDNDGSITINGSKGNGQEGTEVSVAGKTFNAYRVLTAELANGENAEGGIVYRVPEGMEDFYAKLAIGVEIKDLSTPVSELTEEQQAKVAEQKAKAAFDAEVVAKIADMNAEELQLFAEKVLEAAKEAQIQPETATAEDEATSVTIGNLPLGYYVVEDAGAAKPISALALTTTDKNASVNIKASQPVIDKNIDGANDTDPETVELVKYNNTSVGDKVPYVVNTSVPEMTGYKKYFFIVNDTLSKGLTFNDDVVITMPGVSAVPDEATGDNMGVSDKVLVKDTDYTVTVTKILDADGKETGETGVEIVFKNFLENYKEMEGAPIVITYSATVNKDAVIGVAGNPNKVTLQYSNKPNVEPDSDRTNPDKPNPDSPNPPVGVTPESETRTYVAGIELRKVDDKEQELTGAEFRITGERLNTVLVSETTFEENENGEYWKLKNGTYTKTAPIADKPAVDGEGNLILDDNGEQIVVAGTENLYESTTQKYVRVVTDKEEIKKEDVELEATVDESGILRFNGLAAGVYTITELKAPNGYNLLENPITVKIDCIVPAENATSTDCTWKAVITFDELSDEQIETIEIHSVVELANDKAGLLGADVKMDVLTYDSALQLFPMNVVNMSGALLPSTGGIGTTIFYVVGGIMVFAAVVLLVTKKRMSAEKK